MDAIEKRARELLAAEYAKGQFRAYAPEIRNGTTVAFDEEIRAIVAIIAALTPPEGFVLVPIDSVRQCGCGCHRYCCGSCGTELGGHSYEPTRPEVP